MSSIDLALLVIRLILGVIFIIHGGQKLFGWYDGPGIEGVTGMMKKFGVAHPTLLAWLVAFSEFGGGLLVLVGLLTPLAAAVTVSVMLTAVILVHGQNGFFNKDKGYEFNLSLIALGVALMLTGAGAFSIDQLLGLAVPLGQLPAWVIILLTIIPFGGIIATELSRQAKDASQVSQQR